VTSTNSLKNGVKSWADQIHECRFKSPTERHLLCQKKKKKEHALTPDSFPLVGHDFHSCRFRNLTMRSAPRTNAQKAHQHTPVVPRS